MATSARAMTDAERTKQLAEAVALAKANANRGGPIRNSRPATKPLPKAIAPATGGIRASNDPSNPEIAQKLADTKTYMQSVGKADTGYEPPGSMFSSLAGKSPLSGPLGSSGAMATPTAPPGGGLNMAALNASKAQNPGDTFKKGGRVKAKAKSKSSYSSGGKVSSASKRGDGCAQRGKTKGRMI